MSRPTAGAMVCGWITLAPKYASSMASLYDSESMTLASGTRRGSADSTPSTSVQMWISLASSSEPKIEPEKSLPLRPSVVCTPRRSRGDEAGDDQRALEAVATGTSAASLARDSSHCTAGPSGPHSTTTAWRASIHLHGARAFAARGEEFAEQLGGPDLAVAGDQVAHVLRGRARELHRVQDAFDVVTVAVEAGHVELARVGRDSSGFGDGVVPRAQRIELTAPAVVLRFGARDEAEQRIGDAAAGREHHAQATGRQRFEDVGDALETLGVRDRRTAEFVYDPGGGVSRIALKPRPCGNRGAKKARQIYWLDPSTRKPEPSNWHIFAPHMSLHRLLPLYDRALACQ